MVQEEESLWEAVEQQEVARLKKEFTWLSQNGVADFQCPKIQSLRAPPEDWSNELETLSGSWNIVSSIV